jgi:hypothetical protein
MLIGVEVGRVCPLSKRGDHAVTMLLGFCLQLLVLVICQLLVHQPAIRTIFDE